MINSRDHRQRQGFRWWAARLGACLSLLLAVNSASRGIASTQADWDGETAAFLTLINNYRQANGLRPLAVDARLQQAADWHSRDQLITRNCPDQPDPGVNACDHTDTLGRTADQRIRQGFGYTGDATAENIYWGLPGDTAQAAFESWRTSDGHNRTMLDPAYGAIGIGRVCRADGWCFWTTTFGDRVGEAFVPPAALAPASTPPMPPAPPVDPDPLAAPDLGDGGQ